MRVVVKQPNGNFALFNMETWTFEIRNVSLEEIRTRMTLRFVDEPIGGCQGRVRQSENGQDSMFENLAATAKDMDLEELMELGLSEQEVRSLRGWTDGTPGRCPCGRSL